MDCLTIQDLEVYAYHGLFESEKELGQKFLISTEIYYDMTQAALDHNLDQSIHYGILSQELTAWTLASKEDLIETLAYQLVQAIFERYSLVQHVKLQIKKPWAPVGLPLDTCAVTVERTRQRVYLSLGTNQGDRSANLKAAQAALIANGFKLIKASSIIETKAWGKTDQADFLNQVLVVESILSPDYLIKEVLRIETELGRVRQEHWGPRVIDIDVLLIDDLVYYSEDLIVPHPYLAEREFVLRPLAEVAPHYVHPLLGKSIRQLLEQLSAKEESEES